jgi:hypothetical protein
MNNLLTATRQTTLLQCPRKHYYRYEIGLKHETEHVAFKFGSGWHRAREVMVRGDSYDECLSAALGEANDWEEITVATLSGLLAGYMQRYQNDSLISEMYREIEFSHSLEGSRTFTVAGKLDGLAVLRDGRLALIEDKTTSDSIAPESDYWLRLRWNMQLFQYILAARREGWDVATVIYDVVRKPSIRQRQNETLEDFGKRLFEDTKERPDFYFARREVPILDGDIEEFYEQRLTLSRLILHCRASQKKFDKPERAWARNVSQMTCVNCEFQSFCLSNIGIDPAFPPAGFKVEFNPELTQQTTKTA